MTKILQGWAGIFATLEAIVARVTGEFGALFRMFEKGADVVALTGRRNAVKWIEGTCNVQSFELFRVP